MYLIVAIVVLGLIVPGCLPVVPPSEQGETSSLIKGTFGSTIYVDSNYIGTGDGQETSPFTTIQAAIDDADPGDTILVYPGEYEENVLIDVDGLTLESTVIHGANIKGSLRIEVDNVSVYGFKFTDPTPYWGEVHSIFILEGAEDALIEGNLIDGLGTNNPPTVRVNGIMLNTYSNPVLVSADIVDNEIINVHMGIYAQGNTNLVATGNMIEGSTYCGIGIDSSAGTEITGNTISNSGSLGIEVFGENVVANCNNITDNANFGVWSIGPQVDATNNWWGDVSGPSGSGPGSGDAVSDYVDYEPWSFTPDPCEAKTMGFWKNHEESVDALLGEGIAIGGYTVEDFDDAWTVFKNAKNKNANTMLAAQLLAAKLNVEHLSHLGIYDGCVDEDIGDADVFLSDHEYLGPDNPGKVKGKDKQPANEIKYQLELFNTDGCP